jgi:glucan phosphoethanolaminetransferase (alkaline phosphatase superfamily)
MQRLRVFGPTFAVAALVLPNVIGLSGPLLSFAPPVSIIESRFPSLSVLAVQRASLVMGLSAALVCVALAVYRWAAARRVLHLALFFILLEIFYRLAYGGAVSPGLLRSVPETSKNETLELLAGHRALTISLSVVAFLAMLALVTSWRTAYRISLRRCTQIGVVAAFMILASVAIGMQQLKDARTVQHLVLAQWKATFPFDIATALQTTTADWLHSRNEAATRAAFQFPNAHLRDTSASPQMSEIYVVVVGETSRRINWSLFGYSRSTTPRLDAIKNNLIIFPRMTSNATNTILSLPLALTRAGPESREIARSEKSIISLLNEAGFQSFWISNQEPSALSSNPISQIAAEASHVSFPDDARRAGLSDRFDSSLVTRLDTTLAGLSPKAKAVIFLHMEGSHFGYKERYPIDFQRFQDGQGSPRSLPSRETQLVDEYDNSIYFTDYNLRAVIDRLGRCNCKAGLIFFSDHGERLFDTGDSDLNFGHGFPSISRQEIEIPFFVWLSGIYQTENPLLVAHLRENAHSVAQLHNLFETIVDLTGVDYEGRHASFSLFSDRWQSPDTLAVLNLEEITVTLPVDNRPDGSATAAPLH